MFALKYIRTGLQRTRYVESFHLHDHALNELTHRISTPSLVSEKWLHKPFMEILSRGNVSATQSSWPINQSSCRVENLPTVAYSTCDGIH